MNLVLKYRIMWDYGHHRMTRYMLWEKYGVKALPSLMRHFKMPMKESQFRSLLTHHNITQARSRKFARSWRGRLFNRVFGG